MRAPKQNFAISMGTLITEFPKSAVVQCAAGPEAKPVAETELRLQWRLVSIAARTAFSLLAIVGLLLTIGPGALAQKSEKVTLIVKTAQGLPPAQAQAAITRSGGSIKKSITKLDFHVVEVPAQAVDAITKNLKADAAVVRVETSRMRKAKAMPSDPMFGSQWALPKIGWDQSFGTSVPFSWTKVAILDTGIEGSHADLSGTLTAGTSILDNSDGLTDPNGHGTWLAGIVAARTNNVLGMAGVGFDYVQVMPVTVLDANGEGQDEDVIAGVIWAVDNGASVILMAFSNPGFSESLQEAIDYAWARNVVLVAAAGNEGVNTPTFPAGDRGVIGVSGTDQGDLLVTGSNFGTSVFMGAPAVSILGTARNHGYSEGSGTSAAAAIVAGSAALLRAVDPALTNGVVVNRLARTAEPAGTQEQTGNGRVHLARALAETSTQFVQPVGTVPLGNGGPFVGPYRVAAMDIAELTVGTQTGTATAGTPTSVTYSVSVKKASAGSGDVTLSVTTPPATPTGVTFAFSPNPIAFGGNGVDAIGTVKSATLTVSTSAATPASTTSFNVRAVTTNILDKLGTLLIGGKLNQATLNLSVPASITYGSTGTASTTGGSGSGAVTYSVGGSGGCSVDASTGVITVLNASLTCTISATKAGDATYNPASAGPTGVSLNKATPTATLAVNNSPQIYDGTPKAAAVSISISSVPGLVNNILAGGSATQTNAATYAVTANFVPTDTANYNTLMGLSAGNFTINKADQTTPSVTGPASVTFGTTGTAAASGGESTGSYAFSHGSSTGCSVSGTTVTVLNASQSCALTVIKNGDNNYNPSAASAPFTVTLLKATPTATVAVNNSPQTYDNSAKSATVTLSGNSVPGAVANILTGGAASKTDAGTYAVTASFVPTDTDNYNTVTGLSAGNFVINPAATITTLTCPSATYTGFALTPCTVLTTGAGGLNQTITPIVYSNNINAGISTASATATFAATINYLTSTDTKNFTINKANQTTPSVTGPASVTFGTTGTAAASGGESTGSYAFSHGSSTGCSVSGTTVTVLNAGQSCALIVIKNGDNNYNPSAASAPFTVTLLKATPTATVAVNNSPQTYDNSAKSATVTLSGNSVPGAVANILTGGAASKTDAGTYAVTASFVPTDTDNYNTVTGLSAGNFVINPAATITTLTCPSATYTGFALTPCTVLTTGAGGLNQTITPIVYSNNINAGISTASATATFAATINYLTSTDTKNFTINKANQTTPSVTGPASVTFGTTGTAAASGGESTGSYAFSHGSSTGCSVSGTTVTVLNAGQSCALIVIKNGDNNYNPSAASAPFTVTLLKATPTATVAVNNSPQTYDNSAKSATVTLSGNSVPGAVANILTGGAASKTDAGTYAVTASFVPTDTDNYNTVTGLSAGNFVINPAATITTLTCPLATYTGFALTPCTVLTTGAGGLNQTITPIVYSNNINAGISTASATATFAATINYLTSTDTKNFTINKAVSTTVVSGGGTFVYNGLPRAATVLVTGAGGLNLTPAPTYSGTCLVAPTTVGQGTSCTASYSYAESANHLGSSGNTTIVITPAALTVTAVNMTKSFGDPNPTFTFTAGVLKGSDTAATAFTIAPTCTSPATAASSVGTYPISCSSGVAPNYSLGYAPGTLSIGARPTTTVLTSALNVTVTPVRVDLTATVSPVGVGPTPVGTVTFTDSVAGALGTVTLSGAGVATLNTSTLAMGPHVITATYNATANFVMSTSAANTAPVALINTPAVGSLNTIGGNFIFGATFTDATVGTGRSAAWSFDDSIDSVSISGAVTGAAPNGLVSTTYSFGAAAIYSVKLTENDGIGGITITRATTTDLTPLEAFVVVYDPTAGFVTGGGWINSPAGAYAPNLSLSGKATFGFVAKYKKGATVPEGNTEFQFHAAGMNFKSTSYDWLVVQGQSKASFKGDGTINGVAGYKFMVSVVDGNPNRLRMKITQGNVVVYDNMMGSPDDADVTGSANTILGGGNIEIQAK